LPEKRQKYVFAGHLKDLYHTLLQLQYKTISEILKSERDRVDLLILYFAVRIRASQKQPITVIS